MRGRSWRTVPAAFAVLAGGATTRPAMAQQAEAYVVRQGGKEIGRERLTLSGASLRVETNYPSANTRVEAMLERSEAGAISTFRLRATGINPGTIAAAGNGARLVVRTERGGAESARELPGGRTVVLADDNALGLYLALAAIASPGGTPTTIILPRAGRRHAVVARRDGNTVTWTGEVAGSLNVDAAGQLERLELPAQQLSVTRAAN